MYAWFVNFPYSIPCIPTTKSETGSRSHSIDLYNTLKPSSVWELKFWNSHLCLYLGFLILEYLCSSKPDSLPIILLYSHSSSSPWDWLLNFYNSTPWSLFSCAVSYTLKPIKSLISGTLLVSLQLRTHLEDISMCRMCLKKKIARWEY